MFPHYAPAFFFSWHFLESAKIEVVRVEVLEGLNYLGEQLIVSGEVAANVGVLYTVDEDAQFS